MTVRVTRAERLARISYEAYTRRMEGLPRGALVDPSWHALSPKRREAWMDAAAEAVDEVAKIMTERNSS